MIKLQSQKKLLSVEEVVPSIITMILLTTIYLIVCYVYMTAEDVIYCYNDVYCYVQSQSTIPMLLVAEFYIIYNFK